MLQHLINDFLCGYPSPSGVNTRVLVIIHNSIHSFSHDYTTDLLSKRTTLPYIRYQNIPLLEL